jgi:hypothetical protein
MLSIIGIKKTIKQYTADMDITDSVDYKISTSSVIQGVFEVEAFLPTRDSTRRSKEFQPKSP